MATSHSTRLKGESSSRHRMHGRVAASAARRGRFRTASGRTSLQSRAAVVRGVRDPKWILELQDIAHVLGGVHASCVTAQLALSGQNAEQDGEIMQMLRMHVSDPVGRQAERLDAVVTEMRGAGAKGRSGSGEDGDVGG